MQKQVPFYHLGPRAWFITGTDTSVGKTFFACWLVRQWRREGHPTAQGFKPIASGGSADGRALWEAGGRELPLATIAPVTLQAPIAPAAAIRREKSTVNWPRLQRQVQSSVHACSRAVVEGAGGWMAPLDQNMLICDWAVRLGYPVIVVTRPVLGAVSQTLLTLASIRHSGLPLAGVVANFYATRPGLARTSTLALLQQWCQTPVFSWDAHTQRTGRLPTWLQ